MHRDVKPANFVMGTGKAAQMVNVIDFGLAKKFRDARTAAHIPYKQDEFHGVGTSLFAAISTHLGVGKWPRVYPCPAFFLMFFFVGTVESSRRDDLESLAYMLIYFIRGSLPWRKIRASAEPPNISHLSPTEQAHARATYNAVSATWDLIRDAKIANEERLTLGLPPEFDVLYRYARTLEFDDLPDYEGLRNLFRGLADRVGVVYDGVFDWTVPEEEHAPGGARHGGRSASEGGSGSRRYCEACNARKR